MTMTFPIDKYVRDILIDFIRKWIFQTYAECSGPLIGCRFTPEMDNDTAPLTFSHPCEPPPI